jgi:hypothetical protein
MSKDVFERLFETTATPASSGQASFLERSTLAALVFTSFVSIIGVVVTLIESKAGSTLI